jgi:hypothetical protein
VINGGRNVNVENKAKRRQKNIYLNIDARGVEMQDFRPEKHAAAANAP